MSWQLFDRIASFTKSINLYRKDSLYSDQSDLNRLTSGGEFLNFGHQNSLLEQTNLQINRLERYKDFDQMDEVGAINLALDLYADEASLIDPELKHAISFKCKSNRVKRALEDLFYNTLLIDHKLRPMVRHLCKYGDFAAEIIPTKNRNGVSDVRFMNVYNFTRVETRYGDLVGFFFQDQIVSQPLFLHPWQVMHLRLTSYENIYHPYGRSLLDGARKHFKQLRLMEDSALIYRVTRAPEKRVFTIPVGNIPTPEVPQYIELIARQFKKKKFFDPATGDVNERWHPLIQEDDFWLPMRANGEGPQITTLPGAENLDDIKDIEYFKKNMVSGLKIPFSRVGLGEGDANDERSLSQVSPEFAKAVQYIQREVAIGLKKVAIVHLALAGFAEDDLRNFEIVMTASSAIDELYRIETWQSRANVIDALRATEMFPKRWILKHFTDLTDDEIDEMEEEMEQAQQAQIPELGGGLGGGLGGMGGMGGPELPPLGEPVPADMGMMPPGGEEAGLMPPGPEGMSPALPENYDLGLEDELNRLLIESDSDQLSESVQKYLDYQVVMNNGFDYMLNSNELDGLSTDPSGRDSSAVLVESILDQDEIQQCKDITLRLLAESAVDLDEIDDGEITIEDLPSRMVMLD